ncbi:50S ribosomal protein L23, partial [candidate division WOR-1 bacterium RIFOXYD2_FULL_41_8]
VGSRTESRYVFFVNPKATKVDVAQAIEKIYKVKVTAVNTCSVRAKRKVVGQSIGRTSAKKKAYVSLAAGQKIEEIEA